MGIVDLVCRALGADLCEFLEYVPDGDGRTLNRGETSGHVREPADGRI